MLEVIKKRPCFFSICQNDTEREGIEKGVFARVKRFLKKWKDVRKGDIGFCWNTDSDTLLGIFVAESEAGLNIVPDCSFNEKYPAQIKVRLLGKLQRIENASEELKAIGIDPEEIRYKPPQNEKLYYPPEITEKVISLFQKGTKLTSLDEAIREILVSGESKQEIPVRISLSLRGYFASRGFQFTDEQIFSFYNALKTKGFVILAGLSGTGKTKIAQLFAELVAEDKDKQLCFLSVRPEWRDTTYLLGYYNPITENYQSTPLLKFILNAVEDVNKPYFLILDEMNLAHVEYYFADFLSVLESGREDDGFTKEAIKLHSFGVEKDENDKNIPSEIKLPPNLYIIGTVNIDETTYMFSPKVLDRAFTIEFREVDLDNYPPKPIEKEGNWAKLRNDIAEDLVNGGRYYRYGKDDVKKALEALGNFKDGLKSLNDVLLPYDLGFAYRVVDEIAIFLDNWRNKKDFLPNINEDTAKDLAIMMKVLPKFHGPKGKVEVPLLEVLKWSLEDKEKTKVEGKTTWEEIYETLFEGGEIREEVMTPRKILQQWQQHSEKFRYPFTAKKVLEMLARLYETGFTSFL